jgi:hypothetical protein
VNATTGLAVGAAFQELAVAAGQLPEAASTADAANVVAVEFGGGEVEKTGDPIQLVHGDPDIAGRTATAVAALGAGEGEAVRIPGTGDGGIAHGLAPQHFLYFFPEPQGQGSFRPTVASR